MGEAAASSIQQKLQANIRQVRDRIAEACERAGRARQEVRMIAVTKSVDLDVVRLAFEQGLNDLAENRVQELCRRAARITEVARRKRMLAGGAQLHLPTWHMIGHLQRNKVKKVLEWSNIIHAVDSLRLAEEIDEAALKLDRQVEIMLQVHLSEERSKYGLAVGAVRVVAEHIRELSGLVLTGLMTMAPLVDDPEQARGIFARLREIAADLKEEQVVDERFVELSMGMTNDFEVAIEEEATMVRIGSALFEGLVPTPSRAGYTV